MRAEPRADRLEKGDELPGLEVLRSIERHVLQKMREPALVVVFVNRADVDGQTQRNTIGGPGIATDVVPHPVGQLPRADRRIDRQYLLERQRRRLRRRRRLFGRDESHERHEQHDHRDDTFHLITS